MCESEQPAVDISTPQGARQIHHRRFQARPARTVHVLEAEDVLFHYNSAVMMVNRPGGSSAIDGDDDPDGSTESSEAESGENVITGVRVLYAAFRFFEANPQKRLVLAGHTDTSGSAAANFELSELRARNILSLLVGDRDAWIEICQARHRVEDYQQILRTWAYYEGPLNNSLTRVTREGVRRFTEEFNELKANIGAGESPAIPDEGMDGRAPHPETWGAIFDTYQYHLSSLLQCPAGDAGMREWRERIRFVDDERRWVACGESFPVEQFGRDNYRSQANRRVELLFFDREEVPTLECPPPGEVVHQVQSCPLYRAQQFERVYVDPSEDFDTVTIDLQTVDQFSHPVGNVDLTLSHNVGTDYQITTDADGFHSQEDTPVGIIRVFLPDGTPVRFAADPAHNARIDTRLAAGSITSLLIPQADEDLIEDEERQRRVYDRGPQDDIDDDGWGEWEPIYEDEGDDEDTGSDDGDSDSGDTSEDTGPVAETTPPRPTRSLAPSSAAGYVMDNIAIAAGLEDGAMNVSECIRILGQYLGDYNASVRSRRFWVTMVTGGNDLRIYDHEGSEEGNFRLTRSIRGAFGAYALYRIGQGVGFLDIRTRRHPLSYTGDQIETDAGGPVSLVDMVAESDRERLRRFSDDHRGQVEVFFNAPSGSVLQQLIIRGGVGLLEIYGQNDTINRHVHDRNLRCCQHVGELYDGQIRNYCDRISSCTSEDAIRQIGPPPLVYRFPRPPGATDDQAMELVRENTHYSSYPAWVEINETLDRIAGRHTEGNMFIRFKLQLNNDPRRGANTPMFSAYSGARTEYNLDIGSDRILTRSQQTRVGEAALARRTGRTRIPIGGGVGHEVNVETGETKTTLKARIGDYGFEIDDRGGRKATGPLGTSAEYNEITAEGGSGVSLNLGPLGSVYMGMHFQGLQEESVLAFACSAPGLFDSISVDDLLSPRTLWSDLSEYETSRLDVIGFEESFWNEKHLCPLSEFPENCRVNGDELEPSVRVAATQLRLSLADWTNIWRRVASQDAPADDEAEESGSDGDV